MATFRDRPYSQFNFRVDLGGGDAGVDDFKAGFQEVAGLGMEIHIAEYRHGNRRERTPLKVAGSTKINDVTLKRGVIGDLTALHSWLDATRNGDQTTRTVTIQLMNEARDDTPVQQWKLIGVRPMKYTGPALTGKGTDVAIEELTLAAEGIEFL